MSLALLGVSRSNSYWLLAGVFVCYFGTNRIYGIAGITAEQTHDRQLPSYFHAAFSGSGSVGALIAGVILWMDAEFRLVYAGLAVLLSGMVVLLVVSGRIIPLRCSHPKTAVGQSDRKSLFRNTGVVLVDTNVMISETRTYSCHRFLWIILSVMGLRTFGGLFSQQRTPSPPKTPPQVYVIMTDSIDGYLRSQFIDQSLLTE